MGLSTSQELLYIFRGSLRRMKLAIVGSRSFTNYFFLKKMVLKTFVLKEINLIVSGGALGVDKMGERFAKEHEIPTFIHKPDWKKYGKAAGMIRNEFIIRDSDAVIAFWDDKSRGTANAIEWAKKLEKILTVVHVKVPPLKKKVEDAFEGI
jgi:hypothetical protein